MIFGGETSAPLTRFNTVRSYSGTDYFQGFHPPQGGLGGCFNEVNLTPYAVVAALGATGFRTHV